MVPLDVRVTTEALDRALRITDTLLKVLETRGYTVEVTDPQVQDGDTQYRYSRVHVVHNVEEIAARRGSGR